MTTYFGEAVVNHISIFQGKGDGTLLPSVEYAVGWHAGSVLTHDPTFAAFAGPQECYDDPTEEREGVGT